MYCISLNKSPGIYFLPSIYEPVFKQGRLLIKTRHLFPIFQFLSWHLFEIVYAYWLQWWTWTFLINDIIRIISEYHAYKTTWMLFIIKLNSLSAASSYQEWLRVKAWASKQGECLFYAMLKHPRL